MLLRQNQVHHQKKVLQWLVEKKHTVSESKRNNATAKHDELINQYLKHSYSVAL